MNAYETLLQLERRFRQDDVDESWFAALNQLLNIFAIAEMGNVNAGRRFNIALETIYCFDLDMDDYAISLYIDYNGLDDGYGNTDYSVGFEGIDKSILLSSKSEIEAMIYYRNGEIDRKRRRLWRIEEERQEVLEAIAKDEQRIAELKNQLGE